MSGDGRRECLLFDLDGTLYLESNGYVKHCRQRACEYLAKTLGLSLEEAEEKRKLALKTSNQTVKGEFPLRIQEAERGSHCACARVRVRGASGYLSSDSQ